jgi:triacylglycerol lipase
LRDGVVHHRACLDPQAWVVQVRAAHLGMVVAPKVVAVVAVDPVA